jgi:predicted membrane channel-forming protein YqfA (hemolysin III family)
MATNTPLTEKKVSDVSATAFFVAIAAWAVPGLGHLILQRWGRALFFFIAVGALAVAGCGMQGEVFTPHSSDPFGALGFLADACSGVFYFLPRFLETTGPDISRAAGDYGTRFIAAAGVVNLLAVLDAYGIACGRRG